MGLAEPDGINISLGITDHCSLLRGEALAVIDFLPKARGILYPCWFKWEPSAQAHCR